MPPQQPKSPIDRLEDSLNSIFLHIGSVFHEANSKETLNNTYQAIRVSKHLPLAIDNWHEAFDDLENELVRARAILRRDMINLRVQNEAKSAPAETGRQGVANVVLETVNKAGSETKDEVMPDAPNVIDDQLSNGTNATKTDTTASNPASANTVAATTSAPAPTSMSQPTQPSTTSQAEAPAPLPTTLPTDSDSGSGIDTLLQGISQYASNHSGSAGDILDPSSNDGDKTGANQDIAGGDKPSGEQPDTMLEFDSLMNNQVPDGSFEDHEDQIDWNFEFGNDDGGVNFEGGDGAVNYDDDKFDAAFFTVD